MNENQKTAIIVFICNCVGLILTRIKIKSLTTNKNYFYNAIPFYWLYYIIKMNIKKQYLLCCLKQDLFNIKAWNSVYLSDKFYYFQIKLHLKTINKINKL